MLDWVSLLVNSCVGLITGGVAAAITARIAIKKFYKEKWWERKLQAYNSLIDSLIEIENIYVKASNHFHNIHKRELSNTHIDTDDYYFDWKRFNELSFQIQRIYIFAPISLSQKAKKLLEDYFKLTENSKYSVNIEQYPEHIAYNELEKKVKLIVKHIVEDASNELKFN
ncbi:hypothetical protein AB7196_13295 [Providencia rettgeri]